MTETVQVRVLREHSGDQGHQAQGATYETSKAHARELAAQGLVEVVGSETPAAKAEAAPLNKAEPAPANKAETPPVTKAPAKPKADPKA